MHENFCLWEFLVPHDRLIFKISPACLLDNICVCIFIVSCWSLVMLKMWNMSIMTNLSSSTKRWHWLVLLNPRIFTTFCVKVVNGSFCQSPLPPLKFVAQGFCYPKLTHDLRKYSLPSNMFILQGIKTSNSWNVETPIDHKLKLSQSSPSSTSMVISLQVQDPFFIDHHYFVYHLTSQQNLVCVLEITFSTTKLSLVAKKFANVFYMLPTKKMCLHYDKFCR